MSDRRNALRYTGAPDVRVPTMPTNSGTSLIDLITGNTPKNLLGMQQQFAGKENQAARQHETEINQLLNQHEIEMQKLQTQLAKELANTQYAIQQAAQHGITPEQWAEKVAPIATQKAVQNAQNELASMSTDKVKEATTTGEAAKKLAPTVPLTEASKQTTPMGAQSTMTDFARQGGIPDISKGSVPTQNVSLAPTMMNPKTNQPMMFQPVTTQGNTPATFTPGSMGGVNPVPQRPIPIDPSIRQAILNNGSQQGMTPPDDMGYNGVPTPNQPTSPIPAVNQGPNGQSQNYQMLPPEAFNYSSILKSLLNAGGSNLYNTFIKGTAFE